MKKNIIIVTIIFFAIIIFFLIYSKTKINNDLSDINLNKAKSLMIVAHPDDETIWGGAHLLEDDYLVICVTCGANKKRVEELKKAMKISNDQYIALGYPNRGKYDIKPWENEENDLINDLKEIIKAKKWNVIVTHNLEGEYGHPHHKKTNEIVTNLYNELNIESDLYFFGKYYTKDSIKEVEQEVINKDYQKDKIKMIDVYKSQSFIKTSFNHMFDYEQWAKYEKE